MSGARILDRGFTHVGERRHGPRASVRTLTTHTVRRVLGLRRRFRHKVVPLFVLAIAYLPAAAFVGVATLLPEQLAEQVLPSPVEFLGSITTAIVVFTAFSAPETLCPDRRDRSLGLYLASPLTRTTYLLAKALALIGVMALITLGPPLLVQVGLALLGVGPSGPVEVATAILRAVAGGLVLSLGFTAIGLAGSSLTDRRAFASAGILLTVFLLSLSTNILTGEVGLPAEVGLLDPVRVLPETVARLYGESSVLVEAATPVVLLGALGWVVVPGAVAWSRYRRLEVGR